jgi:hypothetical protein
MGIASEATNRNVEGITISLFRKGNARDSMRFSCEGDSNEMDENEEQSEKQFDPRIWTVLGIKID